MIGHPTCTSVDGTGGRTGGGESASQVVEGASRGVSVGAVCFWTLAYERTRAHYAHTFLLHSTYNSRAA